MRTVSVLGHELQIKASPTFLDNAVCPRVLKLKYIERVPDVFVRVAALRGKAAHEAIADLTKICLDKQVRPSSLDAELVDGIIDKCMPREIAGDRAMVAEWVGLWCERFRISHNIHGYEEKIALDEDYEEVAWKDASFRGVVDVIDKDEDHVTITDYKSQPHIMPQSELDEHRQLTFYAWLVSKLYPSARRFTCRIWYLRYGFYHETTMSAAKLESFEKTLMLQIDKLAEIDSWDPIPGTGCHWCDYIHSCPIALDTSSTAEAVVSQDQAVRTAQWIEATEKLLAKKKDALKEYVKANDSVRIGEGYAYGFKKSTSAAWDAEEVEKVLSRYGHKLLEVASLDSRKMSKLIKAVSKENEALEADLLGIQEEKHSTRFSGYKL